MEKRLKQLTVSQIRKVYCKMMKTKQTKLKKKDIISKLLKPLKRKYRVTSLLKTREGERMPETVIDNIEDYLTSQDRVSSVVNKAVSDPFKNLLPNDPNKYSLIKSKMRRLEDAQLVLNKFDQYNMKAIEKKYNLYSGQLDTVKKFIEEMIYRKELVKKDPMVLENILDVMVSKRKEKAGYKYSVYDIFTKAISMLYYLNKKSDQKTNTYVHVHQRSMLLDFMMKILISKIDVNKLYDKDEDVYTTPLILASKDALIDIVKMLLEHGANVNLADFDGDTALLCACQHTKYDGSQFAERKTEIVKILLKHEADVNIQNENGVTSLMSATQSGNVKIVKMLLEHGANVNIKSSIGNTALMDSLHGNADIVRMLLEHGADVSVKINSKYHRPGGTLLSIASYYGYTEIVKILLEHGVNVNEKNLEGDFKGETVLMIVCSRKFFKVSESERVKIVKMLLEYGADVNIKDNANDTALILSVRKSDNFIIVKTLLENGAYVNARNNSGKTALSYTKDKINMRTILLEYDAEN